MYRNKIAAALVAGALLAAGLVYHRGSDPGNTETTKAEVPVALPATAPVPAASEPASAPEADDPAEPEIARLLKGRDFSVKVTANGNDKYLNLDVGMDDGRPISLLRTLEGEAGELANVTFSSAETFELIELIPGEPREQIVSKGDQWLMRGEGVLGTYVIYRIDGEHLQELIHIITRRDREEDEGMPALKLDARIEHVTRNGTPAIVYHVKEGGNPGQTIEFLWNGQRFEDASGAYEKIAQRYAP